MTEGAGVVGTAVRVGLGVGSAVVGRNVTVGTRVGLRVGAGVVGRNVIVGAGVGNEVGAARMLWLLHNSVGGFAEQM